MATLEQLLADLTSGDEDRAQAAVPPLAQQAEAALPSLLNLLTHPLADVRWWAARALATIHHVRSRAGLQRALSDPDAAVAQCAARALQDQPHPDSTEPLIVALASSDPLLSRLASAALAAIGSDAIPALAAAAKSPQSRIRMEATRALASVGHPQAIGPLFQGLDDPSQLVSHWAEEGLARLGVGMTFFPP